MDLGVRKTGEIQGDRTQERLRRKITFGLASKELKGDCEKFENKLHRIKGERFLI